MERPSDTTTDRSPAHVWVYGNDHSPWVQAVLLGLYEKGVAHAMVLVPPLSVFANSGVLMPAARIDEGEWLLDSERILVELGFPEVKADDRRALRRIFASAAMRRADDAWAFWHRFSFVHDGHPVFGRRLWNQFWRAFSMLYFFLLISLARRRIPRATEDQIVSEFSYFQEHLRAGQVFLEGEGEAPGTVDLQLFGLVQMCASIPGASLSVLREAPELERLREWIAVMQHRFSGYDRLYTAPLFEPVRPEMQTAGTAERVSYWAGAAFMWNALPITLPLVFYFVRGIRKKGLQQP